MSHMSITFSVIRMTKTLRVSLIICLGKEHFVMLIDWNISETNVNWIERVLLKVFPKKMTHVICHKYATSIFT